MSTMVEILQRIIDTKGAGCSAGICRELRAADDLDEDRVKELFAGWEHFSGSDVFPVPDPKDLTNPKAAGLAFANFPAQGGFVGKYGELRLKLAAYLLEALS